MTKKKDSLTKPSIHSLYVVHNLSLAHVTVSVMPRGHTCALYNT